MNINDLLESVIDKNRGYDPVTDGSPSSLIVVRLNKEVDSENLIHHDEISLTAMRIREEKKKGAFKSQQFDSLVYQTESEFSLRGETYEDWFVAEDRRPWDNGTVGVTIRAKENENKNSEYGCGYGICRLHQSTSGTNHIGYSFSVYLDVNLVFANQTRSYLQPNGKHREDVYLFLSIFHLKNENENELRFQVYNVSFGHS